VYPQLTVAASTALLVLGLDVQEAGTLGDMSHL
jgi:hypothetical protein